MKVKYLRVYLQRNKCGNEHIYSAHVGVVAADGWKWGSNLFEGTPHKPTAKWEAEEAAKHTLRQRGLFVEKLEFTS